ncbi:hypothetical protein CCR97_16420 [Rhodoplanes elegans]|uniref:Uncharacterized protein n=1 Tax=Rhodoplanes elegans TaxID=29408 RepID=A0A327KJE2_9BRAD|nr:hypothetical protein [Rhodoplanes elegans]MBK5959775.1 hypothetical protein [Rhodoplanes elegans]RAI38236.1 hypothetical protein CH338_13340 [Rhodoplanes elegans]
MTDRRHGPPGERHGPRAALGAADRTLIRAAAIDLMLHLARTLPPPPPRPRPRGKPGAGQT